MLSNPLVSIIIPTQNSEQYLEVALASIVNQTYSNIEVIVMDYQSTDSTLEIAKSYTQRVYQSDSDLTPEQYNQGVAQATGQYLYLMEPHWILEPTVIGESVLKISGDNQAIVIHTTPDNRQGFLSSIRKLEIDTYKYSLDNSTARFFGTRLYRAIGGLKPLQYGWDYDLQTRLDKAGIKSIYIDAEAMDLAQPTQWRGLFGSFYDLGYNLREFLNADQSANFGKLSPLRQGYFKYRIRFAREPALTIGFGFYLMIKYLAGTLGLIHARINQSLKNLIPTPILTRRNIPISNKPIFYE
ncbi:MAG: glycosyltransferase [Candidatus Parcubacteria bacterium]|nr:glycosyltransferase [Candidatus Paceibacterota bacterium]